jgi:hypothetical protein
MSVILYPNTESLSVSSPEYNEITKLVLTSYPKACICMIDKITSPQVKERYDEFKKVNPTLKEYTVYHGTKRKNIESIINYGFVLEAAKVCAYGHGIYFARDFALSWGYTDIQETIDDPMSYIFICKILPGPLCVGSLNSKAPSGFSQGNSASSDTATIFSIPNSNQMFPEYLVRFHKNSEILTVSKDPYEKQITKTSSYISSPLLRKLEAKAKRSKKKNE